MNRIARMEEILKGLEEARKKETELVEIIDLHHALLLAQADARVPLPHPEMESEKAKALLERGTSLLQPEDLEVDWEAFAQLCNEICRISSAHQPELGEGFEKINAFISSCSDKRSLVVDYLRNGLHTLKVRGEGRREGDLSDELLAFVLNNALHPFLRAHAEVLAPLLDDSLWYRGYCPICGGQPDFAVLEAGSGARRLLCSRCDNTWLFRRLGCPFCGVTEPDKLSYYLSEDEVYRLYVCQVCNRYLKTIDLRQVSREVIPPVERILTVAMDVAAREAGYS
jgi:FdhE protein